TVQSWCNDAPLHLVRCNGVVPLGTTHLIAPTAPVQCFPRRCTQCLFSCRLLYHPDGNVSLLCWTVRPSYCIFPFIVVSEEVFTSICEALKTGISLRQSCHNAGIDPRTFYDGVEASPERSQRYARARNIQTEMLADELVELADSATPRDAHVKRLQ